MPSKGPSVNKHMHIYTHTHIRTGKKRALTLVGNPVTGLNTRIQDEQDVACVLDEFTVQGRERIYRIISARPVLSSESSR